MDRVCDEEIWVDILSHNFSDFLNRLREELKDNLEIYFYDFFFLILFSLNICRSHSLFVNTKKAKIFGCTYFEDIKTSNKLFRVFVSILIRVYLNYILSLLNEVEFSEYQVTFFRQEVWSYAGSLFYDFCRHVNIDYFDVLFRDIRPEQYKSNCFKIINKHLVVDLT